jgi:hypothetical protein
MVTACAQVAAVNHIAMAITLRIMSPCDSIAPLAVRLSSLIVLVIPVVQLGQIVGL